jgi:hypothetical protein
MFTGALEFLKDEFVHLAACLDQGGRNDRQAAAFLAVAGSGEQLPPAFQGHARSGPPGHGAVTLAAGGVVRCGEGE